MCQHKLYYGRCLIQSKQKKKLECGIEEQSNIENKVRLLKIQSKVVKKLYPFTVASLTHVTRMQAKSKTRLEGCKFCKSHRTYDTALEFSVKKRRDSGGGVSNNDARFEHGTELPFHFPPHTIRIKLQKKSLKHILDKGLHRRAKPTR